MASIMIERGRDGAVLLDFDLVPGNAYTLGRSEKAHINLDAASISRLHALIYQHDGQWRVLDLGSTKGLLVDGEARQDLALENSLKIGIGPTFLSFFDEHGNQCSSDSGLEEKAENPPICTLEIRHQGTSKRNTFALVRLKSFTIGSDPSCNIPIDDAGLEPIHAVVFRSARVWRVTKVNDAEDTGDENESRKCMKLAPGKPIAIEPLEFTLSEAIIPRNALEKTKELPGKDDPSPSPPIDGDWNLELD
jgi:pSer/pThr/pTyr-binding forkhead associated (FHA) protein